jgi:hypothetical protein
MPFYFANDGYINTGYLDGDEYAPDDCDNNYGIVGDGVNECSDKFDCACKWCSWENFQWFMYKNNEVYYGYDYAEEMMNINNYMISGEMLGDYESFFIEELAMYDMYKFDFGPPNYLIKNDVEKKAERRRIKKNRNKKFFKLAQLNLDFKNPNTYPVHQLEHKYFVKTSYKHTNTKFIYAPWRVKKCSMKFRDRNVNSTMNEILDVFDAINESNLPEAL